MSREFDLEQIGLAISYFERQLEEFWFTELAGEVERNIRKFKIQYKELKNEKTRTNRVS
jgi:hypothetical protein